MVDPGGEDEMKQNPSSKWIALGGLVALIVLIFAYSSRQESGQTKKPTWQVKNARPGAGKVLLVGDETLAWQGEGKPLTKALAQAFPGSEFDDMSSVGLSVLAFADQGLESALAEPPRLVIIALGRHDLKANRTFGQVYGELKSVIESFQKEGSLVLVLGIKAPDVGDNWPMVLSSIGGDVGSLWLEDVLPQFWSESSPPEQARREAAYKALADRIVGALEGYYP